jgi:hypothetical protein
MIEPTPQIRANRALAAITTHGKVYALAGYPQNHPMRPDKAFDIANLIADLHHLADQLEMPWKDLEVAGNYGSKKG